MSALPKDGGVSDELRAVNLSNLHFPHTCLVFFVVMSMAWKSLVRLVLVLCFGFLAAVSVFAPVHHKRVHLGASDNSRQEFSNLSADEINRRTLKAAAAIKAARR
jgi:hypothetical protein